MMKVISDITDIDKNKWNAFVEKHPDGSVFQTFEMFEVYRHSKHNMPMVVAICDHESIIGLMVSVLLWNGNGITKLLTARSIIIGGPLALEHDKDIIKQLLFEYKRKLPWFVVYSEIRPIYDMNVMEETLLQFGFNHRGHYNLMLSLKPELDDLFSAMHKKRRREIKKSEEMGLEFKELLTKDEKEKAVELIKQTYNRKHVPLSYSDVLSELSEYLGDKVHYFGAFFKDQMVASKIDLCYGNLVYAWFAGSDEKAFSCYPNDFLMWRLIGWSKDNGYSYLDFGGGGEPGVPYGVRDYKLKYGCQMYDYGRYQFFHRPLIYKIGEIGTKLIIKR